MPRWKTTEQIVNLRCDGEFFDDNWMDCDSLLQYMPAPQPWGGKTAPSVEDIDLWEVICERSGLSGVYAAWQPFYELYIVTDNWRIVAEFSGPTANSRLESYLVEQRIPYPRC